MKFFDYRRIFLLSLLPWVFVFLFFSFSVKAANVGDVVNFNVDKSFDAYNRIQVPGVLIKITDSLYFYVEQGWWNTKSSDDQMAILSDLDNLSAEFNNKIYPVLTATFGSEWRPGIDNNYRTSVLFESMNSGEGGYFREADEYPKLQMPISNEREMIYVSLDKITDPQVKKILAHEFMHLIAFNQKNQINGVEEDTWLNEARADYSSTVLGYDDVYDRSNLQARVHDFIENPSYSLTDWQGTKYNYATASMFTHYLVDQYGINILTDSLKSKYIGIASINYALQKAGFKDDFSKIFSNWTVTVVLNDCSGNTRYCYLNANLKNLKILPSLNFLPLTGNVSLSVSNVTQNWTGNWIKFIGGSGDLKINFSSLVGLNFQVPYILQDSGGTYAVSFFRIDSNEKGEINIPEFGTDYKSLTIIPSLQSQQMSDVTGANYPYTYAIYIAGSQPVGDQDLIKQLLERIAALKQEIAELQKQKGTAQSCSQFYSDLYFGMSGVQVSCLQNFLKRQGADIYPEGYVTGNFGSLTEAAVIKFQEKYASDILTPIGFSKGSGYVGSRTRAKINQILSGK